MNDKQAIKLIQSRIDELTSDKAVQKILIDLKQKGATDEDITEHIRNLAIATLCGIQFK